MDGKTKDRVQEIICVCVRETQREKEQKVCPKASVESETRCERQTERQAQRWGQKKNKVREGGGIKQKQCF